MELKESKNYIKHKKKEMEHNQTKEILNIDGSMGEGGGSIIRLGASLSFLYNQPIKIYNIRSNRPKPGLRLQHLLGLKTLTKLTNSNLSQSQIGTQMISFIPSREFYKKHLEVNINTAASLGLLLQPIQIAALGLKPSEKINLNLLGGGTFGKWAPSISYLIDLTYPIFKSSGLKIDVKVQRHGFYPKGGARVQCSVSKVAKLIAPIRLDHLGNINSIKGEIIITSNLKGKNRIPKRIKKVISDELKSINYELDLQTEWVDSYSSGVGLHLYAHSDTGARISTGTLLGDRNTSSEKLGLNASRTLIKYIKNDIPVDNYLSDQLIPLMAYAKGQSSIKVSEITNHTKTNLELIHLFNKRRFTISKSNNTYLIETI
jgi:RNA 3'-terminal phosphate cyclase (ATP)